MPREIAIVAGALANKPYNGGEAWVRLSWAHGLARLGFTVLFVEQIEPRDASEAAIEWFEHVTRSYGLGGATLLAGADPIRGLPREELEDQASQAVLLVNISGNLRDRRLIDLCRRRVYVDLDPGYTQIWDSQGADVGLRGHDHYVTVGSRVGRDGCDIPTGGIDWHFLPPPIVLEDWPVVLSEGRGFTTVASWRGGYGRLEHEGRLLGQKAHEFRKIRGLPGRLPVSFEIVLDIDDPDAEDREALVRDGWRLVPPATVSDPDRFRRYVQGSEAEFSVAQSAYVETRSGWIGDRTVRYLASGKPALVQDTGYEPASEPGDGLVTFTSTDDAAAAVESILASYPAHCRAARRLAEELFDSDRVLGGLLEDIAVAP